MIPSVIVEIAWHLPGGRYHSPSIITAHRRWGHPHQRLYQCRAQNGLWTYFCGAQPVFHHTETDRHSFRMFTAQLIGCDRASAKDFHEIRAVFTRGVT